jgi:subtilisin family serine protease
MSATPRLRVVVIDSGVAPNHPLVRGRAEVIAGGSYGPGADKADACQDQLGHGTAVAATLLQFVQDVEIVSLRVFQDQPVCDFAVILTAMRKALSFAPQVINLSLGTTSLRHRAALAELLAAARAGGARIVAPATYGGMSCDPGNLPGIEAVVGDPNVLPAMPELRPHGGRLLWFASPLPPRDGDGIRRLIARGDSLAVATVSGWLLQKSR